MVRGDLKVSSFQLGRQLGLGGGSQGNSGDGGDIFGVPHFSRGDNYRCVWEVGVS